jgi:hypothetical protein
VGQPWRTGPRVLPGSWKVRVIRAPVKVLITAAEKV